MNIYGYHKVTCKLPKERSNQYSYTSVTPKKDDDNQHNMVTNSSLTRVKIHSSRGNHALYKLMIFTNKYYDIICIKKMFFWV